MSKRNLALLALGSLALSVGLGNASLAKPAKGTVLLFLSTDCPVAKQYTPRINALVSEYEGHGFEFKAFFPNDLETSAGVGAYLKERDYRFPFELDPGAKRAKAEGVVRVPTVVVLDAAGEKVYQGAIDDHEDARLVKKSYLRSALAALDAGKKPLLASSEVKGCLLMPGPEATAPKAPTFAEHIAPLLNKHCVECHRPGEVAPFSLVGYENAKKWAPMIAEVASKRRMPPWKAVNGYGEFLDENRLSDEQIDALARWNDAGAPRGDTKIEPPTPSFESSWTLGEPDMVLSQSKPYALDPNGSDEYRNFVLPLNNEETLWITGMDVKPGNPQVVHHVIAFIDSRGQSARQLARVTDGKEGYPSFGGVGFAPFGSLGGWAPGLRARHAPTNIAFEVPPKSSIVMQVHYHKNGKVEADLTKLGLYVAKQKPVQPMRLRWLANPFFRIPAGAKGHPVKLEYKVPTDVTVYGAMPHMHLLGRSMKATVIFPDGSKKPLIYIDDWDFNWQMTYALKQPMKVPAGSTLLVEGTYDNSSDNPNNPNDPPKPITWGEETTDEMFLLVVPFTRG